MYSSKELTDNYENNISFIVNDLYKKNVQSLLVEGGAKTISGFINSGVFDELHCYIAPKFLGEGLNIFQGKSSIKKNYGLKIVDAKMIGDDVKIIYTRNAN